MKGFGSFIVLVVIVGVAVAIYRSYQASREEGSEARTIKSLPPTVQHTVAQMDALSQSAFFNEYEKKKKKVSIAYIMWFLLGWHYLYTKKVGLQFAYWITFGGFFFWAFADLFRMPSIVRSCNEGIARDALQTLSIGNQFRANAATIIPAQINPGMAD